MIVVVCVVRGGVVSVVLVWCAWWRDLRSVFYVFVVACTYFA